MAVETKGLPQSHTAQQNSHKRFIGRDELRRMAASAQARSSKELSRRQGSYSFSQEEGYTLQGEDWRDFKFRIRGEFRD